MVLPTCAGRSVFRIASVGGIARASYTNVTPTERTAFLNDGAGVGGNTGPEVGALLGNTAVSLHSSSTTPVKTHGPLMAEPFISPLALTMTPALSSK